MRHTKTGGWTLVEIAVVTVIIGLIAAAVLPLMLRSMKKEKISEARQVMQTLRDEIIGYAIMHKHLPLDLSTLGHTTDTGGQAIFYRPATGLTSGDICVVNGTVLSVVEPSGTTPYVAFFIAGPGENRNLQMTNGAGAVTLPAYGQTADGYPTDINRAEGFDDIYEYVTLSHIKSVVCGTSTTPPNPPSGALTRWMMNEGSGSTLADSGSAGISATINGATWVMAGLDSALEFNGVEHDYVDLGVNPALNLTTFTIIGWFRTSSTATFGVITSKETDWTDRNWWVTVWPTGQNQNNYNNSQVYTGGELVFRTSRGISHATNIGTPPNVADGTWHFFATQTNGTVSRIYLDGVLAAEQPNPGLPETPNAHAYIGRGWSSRYFTGLIDDVLIYDRMLTSTEISTYYTAMKVFY